MAPQLLLIMEKPAEPKDMRSIGNRLPILLLPPKFVLRRDLPVHPALRMIQVLRPYMQSLYDQPPRGC
jgi:hypothetical protein